MRAWLLMIGAMCAMGQTPDLSGDAKAIAKIPEAMRRELMALGLL